MISCQKDSKTNEETVFSRFSQNGCLAGSCNRHITVIVEYLTENKVLRFLKFYCIY